MGSLSLLFLSVVLLSLASLAAGNNGCKFHDGQWAGDKYLGACYDFNRLKKFEWASDTLTRIFCNFSFSEMGFESLVLFPQCLSFMYGGEAVILEWTIWTPAFLPQAKKPI